MVLKHMKVLVSGVYVNWYKWGQFWGHLVLDWVDSKVFNSDNLILWSIEKFFLHTIWWLFFCTLLCYIKGKMSSFCLYMTEMFTFQLSGCCNNTLIDVSWLVFQYRMQAGLNIVLLTYHYYLNDSISRWIMTWLIDMFWYWNSNSIASLWVIITKSACYV